MEFSFNSIYYLYNYYMVCALLSHNPYVTVVLWTSSHILYGLPLYQKGNISKATC